MKNKCLGKSCWIHSCSKASIGVTLVVGSQLNEFRIVKAYSRVRNRKSRKTISSTPIIFIISLVLGCLIFPLEVGLSIGLLSSLKKNSFLVDISSTLSGGMSSTSQILAICSYSSWPGKIGYPISNSHKIQPKLHMSIAVVYGIPKITSGDR